jgi:hypothetical protein
MKYFTRPNVSNFYISMPNTNPELIKYVAMYLYFAPGHTRVVKHMLYFIAMFVVVHILCNGPTIKMNKILLLFVVVDTINLYILK